MRVIERVRAELPFELEEIDITDDPELERRYRERIPVVEIDGAGGLHVLRAPGRPAPPAPREA